MQGLKGQQGLFDVGEIAPGLVPAGGVYGFLAANRRVLFPEEGFADLFGSTLGRASVPGSVVASALVLQALEVKTDRDAAEALTFDLRWKAACGLPVDGRSFHFSTFSVWRARIAASEDPDRIGRAVSRLVVECGALKGKTARAVDSTILDDAVARQDAVTLLAWQIRAVARAVPSWAWAIAGLPGVRWHVGAKGPGKPDIDWRDEDAKDRLVSELVEDALTIISWDRNGLDEAQLDAVGLLGVLAGQDVEPAEGSDGTDGRWRIAKKVAEDRVISTVDPEARHARKTRGDKRDGFKAHVVVEPDTGIATASKLTRAAGEATSDGQVGSELIGSDLAVAAGEVDQVLGDSAYATTAMFDACAEAKADPIIKPTPITPAIEGGFTLDDFEVDEQARTVTCPVGEVRVLSKAGTTRFASCPSCPLRERCTTAQRRTVQIRGACLAQRAHRAYAAAAGDAFEVPYRTKRPMVERTISWLFRHARRVPYRGVEKNNAWLNLRVAAVNLKRLTALGLGRDQAAWIFNPAT